MTVAQPVTGITIRETELNLATGQNGYVHATVLPEDANEKGHRLVLLGSEHRHGELQRPGPGRAPGRMRHHRDQQEQPGGHRGVPVQVIQKVTAITFPGGQVSLPIRTTAQLTWEVQPADASIQEVTFSSSNRKVATVDENGLVTGLTRGTSTITATATDGSNRRGQIRVTVTQPVEGVSIQYGVYHVQLERSLNIKALIQPSNANNQNVHFTMGDDYIATVSDQKNIGRVKGWHTGTTTITGTTEDGGYTASAEVRVADFNRAVVIDDLYLEGENIRLILRNRSNFTVDRVYFTVETYDAEGNPLVCNADGASNSFNGSYRLEIAPDEGSEHYQFDFGDYVQPTDQIGTVVVTIRYRMAGHGGLYPEHSGGGTAHPDLPPVHSRRSGTGMPGDGRRRRTADGSGRKTRKEAAPCRLSGTGQTARIRKRKKTIWRILLSSARDTRDARRRWRRPGWAWIRCC